MVGNVITTAIVIGVLGLLAYFRYRPPVETPMSLGWLEHFNYQMTKDGVRQTICGRESLE